ncbi:MAG: hypothetical protein KDE58_04345, partial [Caldilineaceae bacterium]|nr:hypothetical protein [Caldilineaceae bacterium]
MDTKRRQQTYLYWGLMVIGLLALIIATTVQPAWADVLPQSAYQQLQAVWQRAGASPQYDYRSTILQTTIPTARLSNAGRSSQTQRIRIDGNLNKTADLMQMELQVGQREPVAVKIEDGQAYGRQGNGDEWSALEQMPDLFAPAGDPLGFLAAMENVRVLGPDDPGLEDISAPVTVRAVRDGANTDIVRYAFDLSGPKFAAFMKAQMEEQLRRSGELPPSMSLSTPNQYVGMTGQGELFVNDAGLPARLLIHIDLPPQAGADGQTAADMVTVFAQWAEPADHVWTKLWRDPTLIMTEPSALVGINAQTAQQSGFALGMTLLILGSVALALSYRRLWAVRAVIYSLIILSMVITPLLQTQQVSAFYDGQQARALEAAPANVESNMATNIGNMETAAFNPHESPVQVTNQAVAAAPAATINNARAAQATATCTVTESSDCDDDGLIDQVEIYQLGTLVDVIDTDGDKISDKAEIQPMIVGGETWYLDPLSSDSNGDGLADSMECSARVDMVLADYIATDTYATCPDTDSDGVPDVFDFDNDGDGVPDSIDSTPNAAQAVADKRFGLALAGYETGHSLYVNLELRPTNDRHLWWHDSALDWPANDLAGQIQRVTDETVDGDGDMRLSPMLEVAIPYDAANPTRGLPVLSTVDAATVGQSTPLADWLDQARLDAYGIVLSGPRAEDGLIYLYVPLAVIEDEVGETPVAFGAALLYEMADVASSWGADHEMRLLWAVNGLNDSCDAPAELSDDAATAYCADTANWISKQTIFQTYYDDFLITSLTVQQDLGASALLIAENGASAPYESDLWHLVDTLQDTYLEAQTVNGQRLTPAQIPDHLDAWGINSSNLTVASYTNLHDKTALAQALIGEHVQTALMQSHSGVSMDTVANLLFVGEETTIDASLATTAMNYSANTLQVDLTGLARQTTGFVRWNPYQYTVTDIPHIATDPNTGHTTLIYTQVEQWDELNVATYVEQLQSDLATVLTQNVLVAAGLATAAADADLVSSGAAGLAANYYLAQYIGAPAVLENSSFTSTGEPLVDADHIKPAEPVVTIVTRLVTLLQETFAQKSLAGLDIETDASSAELVANSTWQTLATATGAILTGVGELLTGTGGSSIAAALATTAAPPAPTTRLAGTDLSDAATLAFSRAYFGSTWTGVGTEGAVDAVRLAISIRIYSKFVSAQRSFQWFDDAAFGVIREGDPFNNLSAIRVEADRALEQAKSAQRSMKFWAAVGLAVDLAVIGIFTTYTIIANDLEPGSPAFNQVLAMAYAQALVATLTFALIFLVPGANIVLAVILFIDAIVSVVCEATGVQQDSTRDAGYWLCGGLTGLLAKALVYVVNDTTQLMDLTKSDQLAVGFQEPVLTVTADAGGTAVGNTLSLTADITNTAYAGKPNWMGYFYPWQLRDENVKESAVDARFQSSAADFDGDLSLGGTAWQRPADYSIDGLPPYPGARYVNSYQRTIDYTMDQAGVNVGLPYFLSEGVKVKQQDCWLYIGPPLFYPIPICQTEETFHDTFHQSLADFFVIDVFPATLAEFHAVAPEVEGAPGMRLAWDTDFPVLRDADNDGLVSAAFNGPDPDDSTPDTDGDGLGDFYEVQHGFDATSADGDCDGLTDYWEAFYNTDPKLADTDQDGLPDSQERFHPNWRYPYENHSFTNRTAPACAADAGLVAGYAGGWGIVYAYAGNTPLQLRVSADPLAVDADGDGLTDRQEQVYGYSPHAPSELKVLTLESAIDTGRGLGPYVTSSDTIAYEATVTNELSGRYLRGLLESELPVDSVIQTQEINGLLPLASTTLSGDIAVAAAGISASQATSLTLRAGAIVDTVPDHLLWLRFNEAAGATQVIDSSVYGTPILSQNVTSNGQYVSLQASDALIVAAVPGMEQSTGGFSVGTWFKLTATNTGTPQWLLYGQYNGGNASDQGSPRLYVDGAGSLQAYLFEGTPQILSSAAGAVSANQWHHALATFDGTTGNLYLDGELVDSGASGPLPTAPRMFLTGNPTFWGGAATYTPYYLDDVEVYGTVLDAQTVRDRYGKESIQNDLRSTDSDLTCVGGSCPTFNAAGATFNQTQRLSLNTATLDFSANQFSIAVNMKPRARTYPFDILGRNHFGRDADHDWQAVYGYQAPNNSNLIFPSLYVGDNGALRVDMGGGANTCSYETAAGIVNFDVEQHVTVSYDGTTFTIYINGEERAAGSPPACGGIQIPNTNALYVGAPNGNGYLNIASVNFTALTDPLNAPAGAEVRLNVNGDGAANNVWNGKVDVLDGSTNNVEQVFNYGAVLTASDNYSFRLWEDDNGTHNNAYESGDDSFVHETGVTYTSLKVGTLASGATGTGFDISDTYRARGTLYWSLSNDNFVGTLRNLRIYDYALSGPGAARLYNTETLALQMPFDEAPGESRFVDESGNYFEAECATTSCPDSGIPGRRNQALRFDGGVADDDGNDGVADYLALAATEESLGLTRNNFTLMAWVKPDAVDGFRRILTAERVVSGNGIGFGLNDGNLLFTTFGVKDYTSTQSTIPTDEWSHVAVS